MENQRIQELILHCLRAEPLEEKRRGLENVSPAEWEQVYQLAVSQKVILLVYEQWKLLGPGVGVPDAVLQKARKNSFQNAVRNIRLYHELAAILKALSEKGIPVIVLKGAYLAKYIYASPDLRFMTDIDLLVQKRDLFRVHAVMAALGYTSLGFPEEQSGWIEAHNHLHPYTRPKAVPVEIHWTLLPPPFGVAVDLAGIWERAGQESLEGVPFQTLSREDLFLHLCTHLSYNHRFTGGLASLGDLARVMASLESQLDWEKFAARARDWKAGRGVFIALSLCQSLLGGKLPVRTLESLEPEGNRAPVLLAAREALFSNLSISPNFASLWAPMPWGEKIRTLWRSSFGAPVFVSQKEEPASALIKQSGLRKYLSYRSYFLELMHVFLPFVNKILHQDPETVQSIRRENIIAPWLEL